MNVLPNNCIFNLSYMQKGTQDQENINVTLSIPLSISSLPLRIQSPSEDWDKEQRVQVLATQYQFFRPVHRERLKEKIREDTEYSDSDASDEEPLPSPFGGKTHSGSFR